MSSKNFFFPEQMKKINIFKITHRIKLKKTYRYFNCILIVGDYVKNWFQKTKSTITYNIYIYITASNYENRMN